MNETPRPPASLHRPGRALWRPLTEHLEFAVHEETIILEACRITDRLDELNRDVSARGALDPKTGKPCGALVEARQQPVVLARLLASLRLPDDLAKPEVRPQRRGAARGTYRVLAGGGR